MGRFEATVLYYPRHSPDLGYQIFISFKNWMNISEGITLCWTVKTTSSLQL